MKIDLDQIKQLIDLVNQTEIAELSVEAGPEKIAIKKGHTAPPVAHLSEAAIQNVQAKENQGTPAASSTTSKNGGESNNDKLVAITAPMVGTFYRASSPSATPYADIGDKISVGQTVCIIEAMKLMNDLPSEVAGRIVKVCADNGKTVEFGEQLFLVDPAG